MSFLASLSVITPWEVEMMAIPSPFSTLGRLFRVRIFPEARFADPGHAADSGLFGHRVIFQGDLDQARPGFFFELIVQDISFFKEDLG